MTSILKQTVGPKSLLGITLVCTLMTTGCDRKKDKEPENPVKTEENTPVTTTNPTDMAETTVDVPVIGCDDQVALTQLVQSVRTNVSNQAQQLLPRYAEGSGITVDNGAATKAVNAMLVDVANTELVQNQNVSGMVTCRASLSLTLPTKDVFNAKKVYGAIGGNSLEQRLTQSGILLNNNMLVNNAFTYVVGMRGGQAMARVAGQPDILKAGADIIAKSKLKEAIDASRPLVTPAPSTQAEPNYPQSPVQPAQPAMPTEPSSESAIKPKPTTPNVANKSSVDTSDNDKYVVPKDENIEMLIIEEDGTY